MGTGMSSHEHGLFFRNLHVEGPEVAQEVLISSDQVGKRLCQHPRGCKGYAERGSRYEREPYKGVMGIPTTLGVILCPCCVKVNELAYSWFQRTGNRMSCQLSQRAMERARSQCIFLVKWDISNKITGESCKVDDELWVQMASRRLRANQIAPQSLKERPDRGVLGT